MRKNAVHFLFVPVLLCALLIPRGWGRAQEKQESAGSGGRHPVLSEAVMCEGIEEGRPWNSGAVLSLGLGRAFCFTLFDPVPEKTYIYHNWFFHDSPSTRIRLTINPPRWGTYSSIQLREADRGPWRVEVSDREGRILKILRFSITD